MKLNRIIGLLSLLAATSAFGQNASGHGTGVQRSTLNVYGDALLKGFDFSYVVIGDRNLKAVKVNPNPMSSQISVGFYDKNFDDPYRWSVQVQSFSNDAAQEGVESGSCRGTWTTAFLNSDEFGFNSETVGWTRFTDLTDLTLHYF